MDEKSIYVKTPQGEAAVKDRSLLMQRELRALLILVDGQATVADLRQKLAVGSLLQMLEELEKLGFIAPLDSSDRADAAPLKAHQDLDFLVLDEANPAQGMVEDDWPVATASVRVIPGYVPPVVKMPRAGFLSRFVRRKPAAVTPEEAVRQPRPAKTNAQHHLRAKRWWLWLVMVAAGLAILSALLFVGHAFWGRDHRLQIESSLAASLGQPVKIERLGFGFSPWPVLTLEKVQVGEQATIRRLDLWPTLASFLTTEKTLYRVRVSGLRLQAEGLLAASGWLAAERRGLIKVQALEIDDLSFAFAGMDLGGLSGQAQLTANGVLSGLTLRDAQGRHYFELKPQHGMFALSATLNAWQGPGRDGLLLPILKLEGTLEPTRWHLSSIEGTLFDGRLEGSGVLQRDGQGVQLDAWLKLAHVELHGLLDALGGSPGIGGPAAGRLSVLARGPDMPHLLDDLRVEGELRLTAGVLRKLDLVEALRQRGRPVAGGETRFESLRGRLIVSEKTVSLSDVRIEAGLLRAIGTLTRQDSGLVGGFHLALGDGVRGDVVVGGTAERPVLKVMGR